MRGWRPDLRRLPNVVVAATLFVGSVRLARRGVSEPERQVFRSVNEQSAWLEPVLWPPMQLGSLWGPIAVGWATWRRRRSWRPTAGVVIGGVAAWQLAKVVKAIVKRGRPADELDAMVRRVGTPKDGLGFVSGHTAVAFSMVTVLWPSAGVRERVGLLVVGLVVAFSRIHVGAHLPLDTVGGAALGVLVGETWRMLNGDDHVPVMDQDTLSGDLPDAASRADEGVVRCRWRRHDLSWRRASVGPVASGRAGSSVVRAGDS